MGSGADYLSKIKPNKIIVEDNCSNRVLTIEGHWGDYDDAINIIKSILEFLHYNSEGVCEHIADQQREI